jgi:hypothetical protein
LARQHGPRERLTADQAAADWDELAEDVAGSVSYLRSLPTVKKVGWSTRRSTNRVTGPGKLKIRQVKWPGNAGEPGPPTPGPARGCP